MARAPSIHEVIEESESDLPAGVLLPVQYYEGLRAAKSAPEQRLMLALLSDAIFCILTGPVRSRQYCEALDWISGRPCALSFEQACEALGFDPDAMRAAIKKLIHSGDATRVLRLLRRPQGRADLALVATRRAS